MTRGSNAEKADSVQHPHDRTLRDVLADRAYFAGESRSILPAPFVAELTRRGNLDQLIAAPTEFVDDTLGQRTCDLLYYATSTARRSTTCSSNTRAPATTGWPSASWNTPWASGAAT